MSTTTMTRNMMTTTLALAVSLGLGSAAIAGEGMAKDRKHDHASMQAHDQKDGQHMRSSLEQRVGKERAGQLAESFRQLDRDSDGWVMISELDASERDHLARFDADDDGRLDRYEYEFASTARFSELDRDADGSLTRDEVESVKPEWVSFVALDTDNDRELSREEYRQFIDSGDWVKDSERYAFDYMDTDRSGNLDSNEASAYVPLASTFTAYDPDGDGRIERTEYQLFLQEVDRRQQQANRVAGTTEQPDDDQER